MKTPGHREDLLLEDHRGDTADGREFKEDGFASSSSQASRRTSFEMKMPFTDSGASSAPVSNIEFIPEIYFKKVKL